MAANHIVCVGLFILNRDLNECVRDCVKIANASNFNPANVEECLCVNGYKWDSNSVSCVIDCSTDPNSCPSNPAAVGECACKISYAWDKSLGKCGKTQRHPQTQNLKEHSDCHTQFGYIFNHYLGECVRNCKNISFATSLNPCDINQCQCLPGFDWSTAENKCLYKKNQNKQENSSKEERNQPPHH